MKFKVIKIIVGLLAAIAGGFSIFFSVLLYSANPLIWFPIQLVSSVLLAVLFIKSENLNLILIKIFFSFGILGFILFINININNPLTKVFKYNSWTEIPNKMAVYYNLGLFTSSIIFLFFGFYLLRINRKKVMVNNNS
jgi:hypothetical protein